MDVGVIPWSEDVSGVTLQAAWLTERNITNPRINITRMISDTVFMIVGFLKQFNCHAFHIIVQTSCTDVNLSLLVQRLLFQSKC